MKFARWLTLPRLIAAITLLSVFAIAFRAPLDTDTFWHLRAGQWQVEHRALLSNDIFSSTRDGQSWLNVHWLSQVLLYAMYAVAGDLGLALFTAVLAAAGMFLIHQICEGDPLLRAFAVLLGAVAAAVFWSARSQMVSFFFSAVVVALLWRYQKRGVDRLWLIPLIMIPWANSHGGFAIGFILLGLALVGELAHAAQEIMAARAEGAAPLPGLLRPVLRIGIIMLVSAAAVLVNPFGVNTLLLPVRTVGIGVLRDFIQEWAAPNFHLAHTWPFGVMLIGTFACVGLTSRRLDVRDAVLLSGTAASALLAGRNISTFALVAAPVLSIHLQTLLTDYQVRLNSGRIAARGVFLAANWLLLAFVVVGVGIRMAYEVSPSRLATARKDVLPIAAVEFLEHEQPPGKLFNSYNWGGYLIWAARDYPVFVDGRTDLYDDAFVRDYLHIYYAQPGWSDRLDQSAINIVLVETSSPLARVLEISPGWNRTYSDTLATVYTRANPVGQ